MPKFDDTKVRPFLRWAGGKRRLLKHLLPFAPKEFHVYHEPFLGSGALFFALSPRKSFLSDYNAELMNCYIHVRDNPNLVYGYLIEHTENTSEEYYYKIRDEFNRSDASTTAQAGRFLYLNRANFNGIYRVNLSGKYNVPYGHKVPLPIPTREDLLAASRSLESAKLESISFQNSLNGNVEPGDFIYLDPPYAPLNKKETNFNEYTDRRFSWDQQEAVAEYATKYIEECKIMISNSDIPEIRELFLKKNKKWNFRQLPVTRLISANGNRMTVNEVVITNYS